MKIKTTLGELKIKLSKDEGYGTEIDDTNMWILHEADKDQEIEIDLNISHLVMDGEDDFIDLGIINVAYDQSGNGDATQIKHDFRKGNIIDLPNT